MQASTAADNLYVYTASTIVPRMERPILKNKLVKSNGKGKHPVVPLPIPELDNRVSRPLLHTYPLQAEYISNLAQKYPLPRDPVEADPTDLEYINLPLPNKARAPKITISDVSVWVDSVILGTVGAILRIQDSPYIERWHVTPYGVQEGTGVALTALDRLVNDRETRMQVLVLTFTPWDLGVTDLVNFSKMTHFKREVAVGAALSRTENLWYYVFGSCLKRNARWFVINNVDFWCFGVFGKGWKGAYVTPLLKHDNTKPSLMQCLVIWAKSSMNENEMGGGFGLPIRKMELLTANSQDGDSMGYREGMEDEGFSTVSTELDDDDADDENSSGGASAPVVTSWRKPSLIGGGPAQQGMSIPDRRARAGAKRFEPYRKDKEPEKGKGKDVQPEERQPLAPLPVLPADSHDERAMRLGILPPTNGTEKLKPWPPIGLNRSFSAPALKPGEPSRRSDEEEFEDLPATPTTPKPLFRTYSQKPDVQYYTERWAHLGTPHYIPHRTPYFGSASSPYVDSDAESTATVGPSR